ncbi:hypothetical protein DACRYDRAFT_116112 [Dacryopinax primogenitus]|uniref:F-box domain-containing protein n=1 Tax=Dacryopinax primogenitus (strain DJM 731) TaxID=1858805 RepID=M5G2I5_DACPD|nr:uncharacterized protein DACRYDRAFT_116112 [Dacryopinax primogenitus]EJU02425.1 hypothetical protein DACRYDRAFT_116112 [Dacryopinax primogenitus]
MDVIKAFPSELLLHIIDFVEWRDLLQLASTCNFFYSLVQQTFALQYRIELGVYGLTDRGHGPHSPYPKRLKHLCDFQSNWRTATFPRILEVSFPCTRDGWTYELQKGIFARNPQTAETHIHLRQLDNLQPHPLAEQSIVTYDLKWDYLPMGWTIHSIQIAGDFLGVLFDPRSFVDGDKIVIWNWRTGKVVAELPSTRLVGLDSFALLSSRILIVPDARGGSINVFLLDPSTSCPVRLKCFALPRLAVDRRMERILCRSDPVSSAIPVSSPLPRTPEQHYKLSPTPVYQMEGNARLLCFMINIWKFDADVIDTLHLFTPLSTFLPSSSADLTSGEIKYIAWKDWGPKQTRVLGVPILSRNPFVTFIHGHRFVMANHDVDEAGIPLATSSGYMRIFDFNQLAIRRDLLRGVNAEDITLEETILTKEHSFGTIDVITSLPFRCVTKRLDVPSYQALMVDGENVVTLSVQGAGTNDARDLLSIHQVGPLE